MFHKILIAQRGEVAVRVTRTCRHLGIETVALYSDETNQGVHVNECDEAFYVPPRADGSLDPAAVVEVARNANADAVYPGYALHRVPTALARALEVADIPLIGTDPDVLEVIQDRAELRNIADRADVQMPESSEQIHRPRRLEVPVLIDSDGHMVVLPERESSLAAELTEGHQTVVAESPSAELVFHPEGEAIRGAMTEMAMRLSRELACDGLVFLEFLVDSNRRLWFNGVRLGLPRQHATTEMVTGVDLVALQLSIACGDPLPEELHTLQIVGHAVSASIVDVSVGIDAVTKSNTATQTAQTAQPVQTFRVPPFPIRKVRVQPSVAPGMTAAPDDRPLIATLSAVAPIRHKAILMLDRILAATVVTPTATNLKHLRSILNHHSFHAGQYDVETMKKMTG